MFLQILRELFGLRHLVQLFLRKVVFGKNARKFAFVADYEVTALVEEAQR